MSAIIIIINVLVEQDRKGVISRSTFQGKETGMTGWPGGGVTGRESILEL